MRDVLLILANTLGVAVGMYLGSTIRARTTKTPGPDTALKGTSTPSPGWRTSPSSERPGMPTPPPITWLRSDGSHVVQANGEGGN